MNKVLIVLVLLVGVFSPFTGVLVQDYVVQAWDWIIVSAGYVFVVGLLAFLMFYGGVLFAKQTAKDKKKTANKVAKATKAKTSKRDGMKYELDGVL